MHLSRFETRLNIAALFFLFHSHLFAQTIQITPASPSVSTGGSVTITADRPAEFSLNGYGSLSAKTATSVSYQAPSGLYPQHLMNGCMVGPDDSVFNMSISSLPVDASSGQWTPFILSGGLSLGFKWGINVINNSTPMAAQNFETTTQLNGTPFPALPQTAQKRENGAYTTDEALDHHMISLNTQTCQFYETNQQGIPLSKCSSCTAESGWTYASTSYALPSTASGGGSADEAGLPLAALTVHLSEFYASHISHALRFTLCNACVGPGVRWPATTSAGSESGAPPVGTRFRLKPSFDISTFPTAAQRVLAALQQYGMILAGTGPDSEIAFATDVTEDNGIMEALQSLTGGALTSSDFEVVDESSYMLSSTSGAVNPSNPYQSPIRFAVLTVKDAANASDVVEVPIALQPVMVGTPEARLFVQAGTPGFAIPSWVTGSSSQSVTWTMNPSSGVGSISSSGVYTPPASTGSPQNVSLTLASPANTIPFATSNVYITVVPAGVIRIDTGSTVTTEDERGLTWLADLGAETGNYTMVSDTSSSQNAWSGVYNPAVWQTYRQTGGSDMLYKFMVPNGTYAVQMMFGIGNCEGSFAGQGPASGLLWGALDLQSQSTLVDTNWNFGAPIHYDCQTPETASMLAQVTNNTLTLAVRATGGNGQHTAPLLNGLTITPVAASALSNPSFTMTSNPSAGAFPSFSVRDLDPKCGQSGYNCRTAIQSAFGLFAQAGGGTLNFPAGTFLIDFPELAQNTATGPWFTASDLLVVPPNTTIQGTVGTGNNPESILQWSSTSLPIFIFARASHSSLQNLQANFIGSMPSQFPYGDVMLLDVLGYNTEYQHENEMCGTSGEMFNFAFVFDSDYVTFNNLLFDSATHDDNHIIGSAIDLKGKGVITNGGGGLTALANGNQITNIQIRDFLGGMTVSGQHGLMVSNISADHRGSSGVGPPGHLLYLTDTFQANSDGTTIADLESTNVTVQNVSEGPDTYSNANAGGTLAIKSVNGGTFTNVTSQHPEGLIQTLWEDQNLTFSNMTWQSSYNLCENVPGNCITPVIYSTETDTQFYPLENLTFKNISLTSTVTPITALLMGNGITVNGFNISTPPTFLPGQTSKMAVLSVKSTNAANVTNYTYTPLIKSYSATTNYNNPFMAWHASSNAHAAVTIDWPSSIPVPTGAPIISSGYQDSNSNNTVTTSIVLQ